MDRRPWLTLLLGLALSSPARATYSIAAVDRQTQQVGGAVTSCVGSLDVGIVYGSLPGVGVIHAQAQLDQRGRAKQQAIMLMMQGVAPSEIIAQITAASFDSAYASRQYGMVDVMGRSAGFTGAQAQAYKRDQQGESGSFAYSVQGNILTSQKVLDQAAAAFAAGGCDLAERLMLALEAGAKNGEGDSRCTGQGIPSDSAFIEVDLPGQSAGSYLKLGVQDSAPRSPLIGLRTQFDAWRKTHPCAAAAAAGSGGASGRSGAGAGGAVAGASGALAAVSGGASGLAGQAGVGGSAAGTSATAGVAAMSGTRSGAAGVPVTSPVAGASASAAAAVSGGAGARTAQAGGAAVMRQDPVLSAGMSASGAGAAAPSAAPGSGSGCATAPHAAPVPGAYLIWASGILAWCLRRARRRGESPQPTRCGK